MPTNMLSRRVDDIVIAVHTANPPSNPEWEAMFPLLPQARCICVFTDGGAPNANQRKSSIDAGVRDLKTAVVTSSTVARGIVTAFSWLGLNIRAFAENESAKAFVFLELKDSEKKRVWEAFKAMGSSLDKSGLDRFSLTA